MENKIKIHRPFSPAVGQYQMPLKLVEDINKYVDDIVKNKDLAKKQDHGSYLAGEVSQEIRIAKDFLDQGLLHFLGEAVENYIKFSGGGNIKNFKLTSSWVVRQFKNEYNPIHWHSGHISGVVYLKLPDSFGDTLQEGKMHNYNGDIVFIHGTKQFLSQSTISFTPFVGDVYIFPNYLMHMVYPFKSQGERRSLSFNGFVDNELHDVYRH